MLEAATDGTKFAICKPVVGTKGKNIPCLSDSPPVLSKTSPELAFNEILWSLGELETMPLLTLAVDPYADMLEISLYVSLLSYPGMSTGDTDSVSGKVTASNTQESPFSSALTVGSLVANATATVGSSCIVEKNNDNESLSHTTSYELLFKIDGDNQTSATELFSSYFQLHVRNGLANSVREPDHGCAFQDISVPWSFEHSL